MSFGRAPSWKEAGGSMPLDSAEGEALLSFFTIVASRRISKVKMKRRAVLTKFCDVFYF